MHDFTRRRFIGLTLSATAATFAGCTTPDSSGPKPPTEWLPASKSGTVTAYIDYTLSDDTSRINPVLPLFLPGDRQNEGTPNLAPTVSNLDAINDPLLTFPLQTGGRVLGGAVLLLAGIGLGNFVDPERPTDGVTELFAADGVAVGMGDINPDDIDEILRSGPTTARFEIVDQRGEYSQYELVEGTGRFAAVSETAVVVGDSRKQIKAVLDTKYSERKPAAEADTTFASLLDATDPGHVMVGWKAPVNQNQFTVGDRTFEPAAGLVSTEDDVVGSITFEPDNDEITADLAFNNRADSVGEHELDTQLGVASSDRSLSTDGEFVRASATYANKTLGIDYTANEGTTEAPTEPGETELPPKIADAVPANGFEFTFVPDESLVRVAFPAELEADQVTLRAVESGNESVAPTPGPVESMNVFVNPDGDVVVVLVSVDGVSAVVARQNVP